MVEVHRAWRKPSAAIGARHIAQLIEELSLGPPALTFPFEVAGRATPTRATSQPPGMGETGSQSVAIRANDLALADLCQETCTRHKHRSRLGNAKELLLGAAVIEVHLLRLE
ncbi:MAG: hypothetical protein ACRDFZ_06240, partial [Candidatus Limnocylindria bacterium]